MDADEPTDGLPIVACTGLTLGATSGVPAELIGAGSAPTTLTGPLVGLVTTPDGSATGFALLVDNDAGGLDLVVPLHPSTPMEGGEVTIQFTDASSACAPVAFTIDPLAAADGELGLVVDGLGEILARQLTILETTPEALAATPLEDVPGPLLPLGQVQRVLDHPDNPVSLRAIADGATADSYPLAVIEALLARTGIREALDANIAPRAAPRRLPASVAPDECTPEAIGEDTQKLSDCMAAAVEIRNSVQALVDQVIDHQMTLALAATIAIGGNQRATIRLVLGLVDWVAFNQERETWARLPNQFLEPVVELEPARFAEDDDGIGTLDARVSATNQSRSLKNYRLFGELEITSTLLLLGVDRNDLEEGLTSYLYEQLETTAGADLTLPEQTFGPVPLNEERWARVSWGAPDIIERVTHTTYRPTRLGYDFLDVSLPGGDPAAFGGAYAFHRGFGYVDTLRVRVEPADTVIDPSETTPITFRVTVENARYPDSITASIEQGTRGDFTGSEGSYLLEYLPPDGGVPEDPDSVHVEHYHRVGARAGGPDRFGFAIVRFGRLVITPEPQCLDIGEQVTFSAEVLGSDNDEVVWSAAVGTIDSDGVYRAPAQVPSTGVDTIRAESVAVPGLKDEVVVSIGCRCNFRFQLGGETFLPQPGDRMVFNAPTLEGSRLTGVTLTRASESWSLRLFPPDQTVGTRPNAPGTWPMSVQGDFGLTSPEDFLYATDPDAPGLLDLEVFTPLQEIQGSVAGVAALVSTQSPGLPIAFNWWFSIRYAPGEYTCTVPEG